MYKGSIETSSSSIPIDMRYFPSYMKGFSCYMKTGYSKGSTTNSFIFFKDLFYFYNYMHICVCEIVHMAAYVPMESR